MEPSSARLFPRPRGTRPAAGWRPAALAERLEHARGLDRVTRVVNGPLRRLAPRRRWSDALHGVPLGQPVHPALAGLPVGFWISAAALDFFSGSERASRVLIALGLAGSLPTVAAGLVDWSDLHREQQRVGVAHAAASAGATALFAASLAARMARRDTGGRLLTLGGVTTLVAGTYLGRYLAFPLGAGASHAEPVAHLAPLGWHDLCDMNDLPDGRLTRRQLGYLSLAVARLGSDVLVVGDRCAHLGGPLHQGKITEVAGAPCITCPWHGSTFRLTDGMAVRGPATARQPAFHARLTEDGVVQVRPARPRRSDAMAGPGQDGRA